MFFYFFSRVCDLFFQFFHFIIELIHIVEEREVLVLGFDEGRDLNIQVCVYVCMYVNAYVCVCPSLGSNT